MAEDKGVWEVSFTNFVNGLGLECLVALGKLENPLTKKKELNIKQAHYIIDTLDMVREKTKGNLSSDEGKVLEELLVYLKMLYVESQGQESKKQGQEEKPAPQAESQGQGEKQAEGAKGQEEQQVEGSKGGGEKKVEETKSQEEKENQGEKK